MSFPSSPHADAAEISRRPGDPPGILAAAVCGAVAAGTALATGEVAAAGRGPGPSPVTAIGSEFIDRFAASLKDLAVALFDTNDKTALIVGIVIVSVALGAGIGVLARRRWLVAPLGFAAFGALGGAAIAGDPQGSNAGAAIAAGAAVAGGIAVFAILWWLAGGPHPAIAGRLSRSDGSAATDAATVEPARPSPVNRRAFVVGAGALVAVTGSMVALSRRLGSVAAVNAVRRNIALPRPRRSVLPPVQPAAIEALEDGGLTPYVVPSDDFFRIDTALSAPRIDAESWTLSVDGMVDEPFTIDYHELLAMESVEETVTIACVSNEVGGSLIGNAIWQGVPLATLLDRAGVADDATQVVGRSVDGWTAGFPTSTARDGRTALVAYAMNGEPLPVRHGYPARLIVAGLYGYVSATKWLETIELTTWEDFDGYWVPRGWSKEGPIKTQSRIDVPGHGAQLDAGEQPIAGVAWAPTRGIARVEVRVDANDRRGDWVEADLGRTASDDTWVQWHLAWDAEPGDHTITVRATDGDGETQTSDLQSPAPDGATGRHQRTVTVS